MMENDAVGIDFGSFRTKIGIFRAGKYEVILDEQGHPWDSYVTFEPTENFFGREALKRQGDSLASTIYAWKNLIGCSSEDLAAVLELSTKLFNKTPSSVSTIEIACGGYSFSPDEITSMFFAPIKERIDHLYPPANCSKNDEAQISKTRRKCVITAPAFLTDAKRQVLKRCLEDAGFEVLHILDEPTAAAISYGFSNSSTSNSRTPKNILTLDLAIVLWAFSLPIENELITRIWVMNEGEKLNIEEEWLVKKAALQALEERLSGTECTIKYPKAQIAYKLNRSQMENWWEIFLARLEDAIRETLKDSGLSAESVEEILLTGHFSKIINSFEISERIFGRKGSMVSENNAVAQGASIFAAHLHSAENPKSYGRVHENPYVRELEVDPARELDLIDWST
ncbi:unnamed protein product, partial [Mesorhabditis spiculigera]